MEVTEAIAHALEADRAEHGDRVAVGEDHSNTAPEVREQTRAARIKESVGWMSPMQYRKSLGLAAERLQSLGRIPRLRR